MNLFVLQFAALVLSSPLSRLVPSEEESSVFWNGIKDYGSNPMTSACADGEMCLVFNMTDRMPNLEHITSYGCADGSRDPKQILVYLKKLGRPPLKTAYLNDLSQELLTQLEGDPLLPKNTRFKLGSMLDIVPSTVLSGREQDNVLGVIGVYRVEYFAKALKNYKEQKDIIGNEFSAYPVCFDYSKNALWTGETRSFEIDNYERFVDAEVESMKNHYLTKRHCQPEDVGFGVTTNTGFISTYYSASLLNSLLPRGQIVEAGNRHLVAIMGTNSTIASKNHIFTMLNNVLGNLPPSRQKEMADKIIDTFHF